jgi:hypothetical protein
MRERKEMEETAKLVKWLKRNGFPSLAKLLSRDLLKEKKQ